MRYAGALVTLILLPVSAYSSNIGHVQQCFTSVLPGQVAILDNDLECPSYPGNDQIPVIGLQQGSRLLLNGHTVHGGDIGVRASGRRARIEGPGTISGMAVYGIVTEGMLVARDVVVDGNFYGIYSPHHDALKLQGVTVRNSTEYGIVMGPTALGSGRITGTDLIVDDNGRVGIEGQLIAAKNLHATGNGYSGVVGLRRVKIKGGIVTGNGAEGFAQFERVDIASFLSAPKVRDVTCDHSANDFGVPWGVCALDP